MMNLGPSMTPEEMKAAMNDSMRRWSDEEVAERGAQMAEAIKELNDIKVNGTEIGLAEALGIVSRTEEPDPED